MARTGAPIPSDIGGAWFSDERLQAAVLWRSAGSDAGERPRYRASDTGIALEDSSGEVAAVHAVFGSGLPGCDSRSLPGGRRDAGTSGLLVPRTRCLDRNPRIRGGPRSSRGLGLPPGDAGVRRLPRHRGRLERARPRRPRVRVGSAVRALPRPWRNATPPAPTQTSSSIRSGSRRRNRSAFAASAIEPRRISSHYRFSSATGRSPGTRREAS